MLGCRKQAQAAMSITLRMQWEVEDQWAADSRRKGDF